MKRLTVCGERSGLRRTVSGILLTLLLAGLLASAFSVQPVKASGTIYIRADGSIDPPTAPITTIDNITYILTANITSESDGIVIERDNIVLDGAGYAIQGLSTASLAGIDVSGRNNVTIMNTRINFFDSAIWLYSSTNCTIIGNDASYNWDGIYLRGSSHCTVTGNVADGTWGEGIMISYSSYNTVRGNNASDNLYGINLSGGSSNNTVTQNNVAGNGWGILIRGYDNIVFENNATNNNTGIGILYGSGNNISKNSVMTNGYGIYLRSSNNTIHENIFVDDGLSIYDAYMNTVENNSVNGKPLIYLESVSDRTIEDNAGQVILVDCDRIQVENLNLSHTDEGIQLWNTNNTTITGNTIALSVYGIRLWYSSDNKIYHNNFINNTHQASTNTMTDTWDDGYPSGGNYWSNYNGTDLQCGQYQNLSGNDGLGDTPYRIDSVNLDDYPLMEPFSWALNDVAVETVTRPKHVIGRGINICMNVTVINQGAYPESFNATLYANATIIEKRDVELSSGNSTTLSLTWNTSSFAYGSYTVWAYAEPVLGEAYTVDNTYISSVVIVTIPGDIDGDGSVSIFDIVTMADIYGSQEGDPDYNPNCDIDGDGDLDIFDIIIAADNYGESW